MIICEHPQGSDGWIMDRLGKVTGSCFSKIMTPIQRKPSQSNYIYQLAAERIAGIGMEEEIVSFDINRGNEFEEKARQAYELLYDCEIKKVGFCLNEKSSDYGFSPDGLVEDEGGVEIKCPRLPLHLKYSHDDKVPTCYLSQVYGSLFVSERDWWDFVSYHDDHLLFVKRVHKTDNKYLEWQDRFIPILNKFIERLNTIVNDKRINLEATNEY